MSGPTSVPQIEGFALGPFGTNCYLVHTGHGGEGWVVDASYGPEELIDRARALELKITAVIITHAHGDHIAGLADVRNAFPGVPVLAHEAEATWFGNPTLNLSAGFGPPVTTPGADRLLKGGETLTLGRWAWKTLHTPGHSPGMIALHCPECAPGGAVIVGDTLFAGSIGRYDYPTSDEQALFRSLRDVLLKLPDDTRVLPGHGPATTIGREKKFNPFLRGLVPGAAPAAGTGPKA